MVELEHMLPPVGVFCQASALNFYREGVEDGLLRGVALLLRHLLALDDLVLDDVGESDLLSDAVVVDGVEVTEEELELRTLFIGTFPEL